MILKTRRFRVFNVEPQEKLSADEVADFERYVAVRHKKTLRSAAWAGIGLLAVFLCLAAPSFSHYFDHYWQSMKQYLLIAWMTSLVWFVIKVGCVWASWQSARETRKEFRDLE
jgi:hypothetical protein